MAHARQHIGAGALLIATAMVAPPLLAQTIYRCANSYSQTPCPGATVIEVDDSRTPAQKAQTDASTAQVVRLANEMEKARLAREQMTIKSARPPLATIKPEPVKGASAKPGPGHKEDQSGPFAALAPAQGKPAAKKTKGAAKKP